MLWRGTARQRHRSLADASPTDRWRVANDLVQQALETANFCRIDVLQPRFLCILVGSQTHQLSPSARQAQDDVGTAASPMADQTARRKSRSIFTGRRPIIEASDLRNMAYGLLLRIQRRESEVIVQTNVHLAQRGPDPIKQVLAKLKHLLSATSYAASSHALGCASVIPGREQMCDASASSCAPDSLRGACPRCGLIPALPVARRRISAL